MRNWRAALLVLSTCLAASGISVTLTPSLPTPADLGQMITWQANATGGSDLRYRFRVRSTTIAPSMKPAGRTRSGAFQMIRDFSTASSLDWTATEREGRFELEVLVEDVQTGETASDIVAYQFLPRTDGLNPVVNPTQHPLVFLFSMPACSAGRVRVAFQAPGDPPQYTPYKECEPGSSTNFYLAGLRAGTSYTAHSLVEGPSATSQGPDLSFTTGPIPEMPWSQQILIPAAPGATQPVLLGTAAGSQIATDLNGRVIWYNPSRFTWGTRPVAGGYMWGVMEDPGRGISYQSMREVDLTGMTVLETNAEAVNLQLVAMGKRKITGFHHEIREIANDRIVALAGVEQILAGVQGPDPVDIVGDMIVVFDRNLNVVWTWDAFDHLDVRRAATTPEVCTPQNTGCPAFYLADSANDWTHGNAVQLTPDGSLLYSARHQDWLIKIDYANGTGGGNILWRLGLDGDFTYLSNDAYPWFSHQHDGNILPSNPSHLIVVDNGNLRQLKGSALSRAQLIELDYTNRTAKLLLNATLGVLSLAVGSAQALENGNYHFDAGFVAEQNGVAAYSMELDPSGTVRFKARATTGLYRTFRMRDMYADAEPY